MDLRFHRYQLLALTPVLQAQGQGSTFVELSSEALGAIRLASPPIQLQRSIADYLDAETARIDALIEKKRRMTELLVERRRKLVIDGTSGSIMPPGQSSPETHSQPVHLALRRLALCLDGMRVPLNREERAQCQGDIPYWGSNGVVDSIDRQLFDEELILLGEDGSPFFDPSRQVAFLVHGPIWVNNHIHVLRPNHLTDPRFLVYALNSVDFGRYITGSTRDKLTQDDMWNIEVPFPDLATQRWIADYLDAETARIDALIEKIELQLALLAERRQALITAAVTGELAIPGVAA